MPSAAVEEPYAVVVPYSTWLVAPTSVCQEMVPPVVVTEPAPTPEITGGGALDTVTATPGAVPTLPAASQARAAIVWAPLVAPVLSQANEKGGVASRGPTS